MLAPRRGGSAGANAAGLLVLAPQVHTRRRVIVLTLTLLAALKGTRAQQSSPCQGEGVEMNGVGTLMRSDYGPGENCQWLLTCGTGTPVLTIQSFATEANYDFVE